MRGVVFTQQTGDALLTGRTWRMLDSAGATPIDCVRWAGLPDVLAGIQESVWVARAGTWQPTNPLRRDIPRSSTGFPLVGIGEGGASVYLEKAAAHALSEILRSGATFEVAIQKLNRRREYRIMHAVED